LTTDSITHCPHAFQRRRSPTMRNTHIHPRADMQTLCTHWSGASCWHTTLPPVLAPVLSPWPSAHSRRSPCCNIITLITFIISRRRSVPWICCESLYMILDLLDLFDLLDLYSAFENIIHEVVCTRPTTDMGTQACPLMV